MSINKGKSKNKEGTRACAEHGYGCTKGCSFLRMGFIDSRPKTIKKKKR